MNTTHDAQNANLKINNQKYVRPELILLGHNTDLTQAQFNRKSFSANERVFHSWAYFHFGPQGTQTGFAARNTPSLTS